MSGVGLQPDLAHHEAAHAVGAHVAGLKVHKIHVERGGGFCRIDAPETPDQVHADQVLMMMGGAAQNRWLSEHGMSNFEAVSPSDYRYFRESADKPGAISLGQAKREAAALVDQRWSQIHAIAEQYSPEQAWAQSEHER